MKNLLRLILFLALGAAAAEPAALTDRERELLEMSPAEYRSTVIPPEVPRAFDVHREGCPVCGVGIKKHGMYAWLMSPDKPFKLQCPECGTVFPDNDFAEYLKTGGKSGVSGKVVDTGRGWQKPGTPGKYWFVAYYHHWSFSKWNRVRPLAKAYESTGNIEFARRLAARLDRYADFYRRYDYNKQSRYAEEINRYYDGRILNAIWETGTARNFATSYAVVKPFLLAGDAELERVTGKACQAIIANIENNMLRVMADDIMSENGKNWGNFGMHQAALLDIAAVLNDEKMVRWVTDFRPSKRGLISIPLDYALYCNFFGDGAPVESPQYNHYWLDNLQAMFEALAKNGVDEFKRHPSSRRILDYEDKLVVCGKFIPASGDSCSIRSEAKFFKPDPADPLKGFRSQLMPGYGVASLQNARPDRPAAAWLSFGAYRGHKHRDGLHFELFAENIPMTPDLGYPESAGADDAGRWAFYLNTVSHNTVVVDGKRQKAASGVLRHYDAGTFAQRIEAEASGVYPGLSVYARSAVVCEPFPGKLVVLDVFRVRGGQQHDWFLHGAGETAVSDAAFQAVPGTLAGENVPYGDFYDAPELRGKRVFSSYEGSGFQFLANVRRAAAKPGAAVTFPAMKGDGFAPDPGAYLKIFPLGDAAETWHLADGVPPRTQKTTQKHLVWFDRRRTGAAPLQSVFASVLETGSDAVPAIAEVKTLRCDFGGAAVRIRFADSSTLEISDLVQPENGARSRAVLTGPGGQEKKRWTFSGRTFEAKVRSLDLTKETVTFDRVIPAEFVGTTFRIGDYAYTAEKIDGATVHLREQSMIRGRFRMVNGKPVPTPVLAAPGMAVYAADRTTYLGRHPIKTSPADDLWLAECGPGDAAVFIAPSVREEFDLPKTGKNKETK